MKLLTRYNRVNILATIIVLLLSGFCYYFILKTVLLDQLDDDLKVEKQEIIDYARKYNNLPNGADYKDQKIAFEHTDTHQTTNITSINLFDASEQEYVPTRRLVFSLEVAGKKYVAYVTKSQEETEDLIKLIVLLTLAMVFLLLLVLFSINRFILNKLWHPFYQTLKELQQFNISSTDSLQLKDDNIAEFKELNQSVTIMSNRVASDYAALKSFTENASHELQTPLAVISSKIELLMQSENFSESQMHDILAIQDESNRLSKLNKSLLLLIKMDNDQFNQSIPVDLNTIIDELLYKYDELITANNITLVKKQDGPFQIQMNEALARILVSNIINNSIKHNIENGSINITVNSNKLVVSNTGLLLTVDPNELFERFKKGRVNADSLGLGLAIVKKICEQYNLRISYAYLNERHILTMHT